MKRAVCSILLMLMLSTVVSVAAQPVEQPAPSGKAGDRPGLTSRPSPGGQQDMDLTQNMDKMAITMTRMAEICEQMIKREMEMFPYKIAAGIGLGILVTLVLLLLIVLEVQWIIYWGRILKERKRSS